MESGQSEDRPDVLTRQDFWSTQYLHRRDSVRSTEWRNQLCRFDTDLRYQEFADRGNSDVGARGEGVAWIGYVGRSVGNVS